MVSIVEGSGTSTNEPSTQFKVAPSSSLLSLSFIIHIFNRWSVDVERIALLLLIKHVPVTEDAWASKIEHGFPQATISQLPSDEGQVILNLAATSALSSPPVTIIKDLSNK